MINVLSSRHVAEHTDAYHCDPTITELLWETEEQFFRSNSLSTGFPFSLRNLKQSDFVDSGCKRVDLRSLPCLTIDCQSSKDLDDAVSLSLEDGIYHLGVHIADVAEYVRFGSQIDMEAMKRGTSIYLPDRTIIMLPPILSEDLCSLNPDSDRKTLSFLLDINAEGQVISFRMAKSLIRSRVKGVYSEVDAILDGYASDLIRNKYLSVCGMLRRMSELAEILRRKRIEIGADVSDNSNGPFIILNNDEVDLAPRIPGKAEMIIQEFMVLANHCVAEYMSKNNLPAIYRLQKAKGDLAEYRPASAAHISLAYDCYGHVTSPIRRLADYRNHQVLSAYLMGCTPEALHYIFDNVIAESCVSATKRSRSAKVIQEKTQRLCYGAFFKSHPDRYTGTIIGMNHNADTLIKLDGYGIHVVCHCQAELGRRLSMNVSWIDGMMKAINIKAA